MSGNPDSFPQDYSLTPRARGSVANFPPPLTKLGYSPGFFLAGHSWRNSKLVFKLHAEGVIRGRLGSSQQPSCVVLDGLLLT